MPTIEALHYISLDIYIYIYALYLPRLGPVYRVIDKPDLQPFPQYYYPVVWVRISLFGSRSYILQTRISIVCTVLIDSKICICFYF